jgi:predicted transcriptional regulator
MTDDPKPAPTVADYMAVDLLIFTPELEINRAMRALLDRHLSGAPVVDRDGKLVGVLSKKDCLKAAFAAAYHRSWGGLVGDYMSRDVQTLDAGLTILQAVERLLASPYRRFPVLRDGHLVGQISRADVLRALVEHWHLDAGPAADRDAG